MVNDKYYCSKSILFLFLLFTEIILSVLLQNCKVNDERTSSISLVLHLADKSEVVVTDLPADLSKAYSAEYEINKVKVRLVVEPKSHYTIFRATAITTKDSSNIYLSLRRKYTKEAPYNFNGLVDSTEIFRQSPHDVNAWITEKLAKQAVPMIALKSDSGFWVALNGSPYLYNNFTSQSYDLKKKTLDLSSGDNGQAPGIHPDSVRQLAIEYNTDKTQVMAPGKIMSFYHPTKTTTGHTFEGIIFLTKSVTLNGLRKAVNQNAADHFSNGKYRDYFGALAFTTAYMNLRVNETNKSKYWVVPSVEYGNTQYGRDAFWISTMLDPAINAECMANELSVVNHYAEYPLTTILWAYRSFKDGRAVDLVKVQAYIDAVEARAKDNYFYSYLESDGRLDFQYWGDVIAFEKTDVITYNQGLFTLALMAAQQMGLKTVSDPAKALQNYQNAYDSKLGYFPISKKKSILGPDPLVPDLLSQLYFGKKLLDGKNVRSHFNRIMKFSKTPYGFKVVATPTGEYLPSAMYDVPNYMSQVNREKMPDGRYFRGGSYFLYDNLFLIDAYLHGIKEAEEVLIWRVSLDFAIGNTTFETLNTKTGEPWKPNMGWNVAIYSIWNKLVEDGKADRKLFNAIDQLSDQK